MSVLKNELEIFYDCTREVLVAIIFISFWPTKLFVFHYCLMSVESSSPLSICFLLDICRSMTSNCSLPIINNRCLQLKQDSIDDTADHPAASAQSGRRRGSFSHALLSGGSSPSETINTVIAKLFRKADYDLGKAQRGIVFLDGMDKIGSNVSGGKAANKQVLREILQTIDGTTVDVTRVGSEDNEVIDTSHIFFVCFGNFDYDIDGIGKSSLHVKGSASVKSGESRLLWKSVMEHEVVHPKSDDSTDSGNGSEEHKTNSNHRRDSSMSIDTHSSGHYR